MICSLMGFRSSGSGTICFGIDAVMLSDFARVKPGEKVLDLGTGTGILPILLSAKTEESILSDLRFKKKVLIWREEV